MKLTVNQIKHAPDGKLSDGRGLFLTKKGQTGSWIWRFTYNGKRRDMGLGKYPDLTLANARAVRDEWAQVLAQGLNPIEVRREGTPEPNDLDNATFAQMVNIVFEMKRAGLRGDGQRGRWLSPLKKHVIPVIGRKRMSEIKKTDIRDAIKPLWGVKHETARKAVNRTRIVFREAQFMEVDCDPLTVDIGVRMLGEHIHQVQHIASTPWQDIPDLYRKLGDLYLETESQPALCLQWMILTLVRSNAARGARVEEVDGDVWTVPPERVKGRVGANASFRVPLPLEAQLMLPDDGYVFGKKLSDVAIQKVLNNLKEPGRPHGFRTSFRTWVQETDACDFTVAETILGHAVGNKVERAYARSDLLERRRPVMQAWADYVTGAQSNVVKIRDRARVSGR